MVERFDEVVAARRQTEAALYRIYRHRFVVNGRKNVVERNVDIVVEVVLKYRKVGIFAFEIHVEELSHIAQSHVVHDVAEVVGHFGDGIVEQHGNVYAAHLAGNADPVVGDQLVDGEGIGILRVVYDLLHKIEYGHLVDGAFVVEDVRTQRALKLPDADESTRREDRAHNGHDQQHHTHDHAYDEIQSLHCLPRCVRNRRSS